MNLLVLWAAKFALGCLAISLLISTLRLLRGPDITDRVLGLDTMYACGLMMLLVLGIQFGVELYFDIALVLAMFSFVGSVAMAKFLVRGEVIEP